MEINSQLLPKVSANMLGKELFDLAEHIRHKYSELSRIILNGTIAR